MLLCMSSESVPLSKCEAAIGHSRGYSRDVTNILALEQHAKVPTHLPKFN